MFIQIALNIQEKKILFSFKLTNNNHNVIKIFMTFIHGIYILTN